MDRIKQLRQRQTDLLAEADALAAKDAEGTISAEETARLDEILTKDLKDVEAKISREEQLQAARRSAPAAMTLEVETAVPASVPAQPKAQVERFSSFGEQLQAVAFAAQNPHAMPDRRLGRPMAAPTGANESIPSDGGFLVQQDFSTSLMDLMHESGQIVSRVRRLPISANANGVKFPVVDEQSRADGSRWGGVRGYWADEAGTVTATKPKLRQMELSLKKLMAVGYATDELLADGAALENIMKTAFTEELVFKTEDAIINGSGSGQPLGIMNSGALVTVAAESGQAAATLRAENILKMWARTPLRSRKSLVWLCNQDIEPQLWPLTIGADAGTIRLWTPPGTDNSAPGGLLLGKPVIPTEFNATLGTVGDLLLVDLNQYVMIDKGGLQAAQSMHVAFLSNEQCFRFTYRLDGQPVERSAKTPFKGTNTISPYVALGTR